jgi:hypothetical protein
MTCVIVLGVPCSGTSVVAGILHHLGVCMGECFVAYPEMEPFGSFEDTEIIALHNLLLVPGLDQNRAVFLNDATKWQAFKQLIDKREAMGRVWGYKDRLASFSFPVVKHWIKDLRVIATDRPFHESVHDVVDCQNCSLTEAKKIVGDSFYARELALSDFRGPILRINYQELVRVPTGRVAEICVFAGLHAKDKIDKATAFANLSFRR